MKHILLTLTLTIISLNIISSPIDVKTAMTNAVAFSHKNITSKCARGTIQGNMLLTHVYSSSTNNKMGYPMFHVFNRGEGNGFIISAGDNCIDDVIAFSEEGSFDMDNAPENMKWWLAECEKQMLFAIEHGIVLKNDKLQAKEMSNINPLLSCTWNQNSPYNDKCPVGNYNSRCPTGCIATALAQIMYYHKWPEYGNGYHEYDCAIDYDPSNKIRLSADFSNTQYKWNKMKDSYEDDPNNAESCDAVATLMYHIGVSLDMVYGVSGSSPTRILEADALKQYFRYKSDIVSQLDVPDDEFTSIVYDELYHKRPVFVCGGSANNVAHAFVCDGYKKGGYFHFNWGWGGHYDAYFLLTSMIPVPWYDFSYDHRMVYRIQPDKTVRPKDNITIYLSQSGSLQSMIDSYHANEATCLTIIGDINGSDILTLRKMAGRDEYNNATNGKLEILDLSQANIVNGGGCYFWIEDETYYKCQYGTKAGIFPDQSFMSTKLKKITLPTSVNTIGRYAFIFCDNLVDVVWNNNIVKIDFSAFNYTSMPSVSLPESITELGPYAFCNMNYLQAIKLNRNLQKIGYRAFEKDNNLAVVNSYITSPFYISDDVFSSQCYEKATLYVPKNTANAYKNCGGWKNFKKIIEREDGLSGDVNGDGTVTINDVSMTVAYILGQHDNDFMAENADVNHDNTISINDITEIVNIILSGTSNNKQAYLTSPDDNQPHLIDLGLSPSTK